MVTPLISTATVGHEFGPYDVTIPAGRANAYAASVGGEESPDYGDSLAPIMVVAAALTRLIDDLGLFSEGLQTVHAGQEVSWVRQIRIGEQVEATARLAANSVRRGNHFATVAVTYRDSTGTEVGTSSTTIIVSGETS